MTKGKGFLEKLNEEEEVVRKERDLERSRSMMEVERMERLKLETMSHLLSFVQLEMIEDDNRKRLRASIMEGLQEVVDDKENKPSPGFMLKALEHLDKSGNEKNANVMGILKQNIVINESNPLPALGSGGSKSSEEEVNKGEAQAAKALLDMVKKMSKDNIQDAETLEE